MSNARRRSTLSSSRRNTVSVKTREKEAALVATLQEAEAKQLESFIKTRNKELDQEISDLRGRLNKAGSGSIENAPLAAKAGKDLAVQGIGLGKAEFETDLMNHNDEAYTRRNVEFKLDPSRTKSSQQPTNDHLVTLLAKIKIKMEDVNMSPAEVKELLLPSDLVVPGEHFIPIEEVTGVLQTDLLLPVTKSDQLLILKNYGSSEGEVNVKKLLSDAGVWFDGPTSPLPRSPGGSPGRYYDRDGKDGGYRDPTQQTLPPFSPDSHRSLPARPPPGAEHIRAGRYDDSGGGGESKGAIAMDPSVPSRVLGDSHRPNAQHLARSSKRPADKTAELLDLSERNLDDLAELHEMLLEEKEYDFGATPSGKHKSYPTFLDGDDDYVGADFARRSDSAATASPSRSKGERSEAASPEKENTPANMEPDPSSTDVATDAEATAGRELSELEQNRLSALERENARLREEVGCFDAQFFEELEDLKYRYARLQEVVGEDPRDPRLPHNATVGAGGRSTALPLDRLSWSVRNSMTAMDRAGLTSPLVSRPRYAHAHTYAPGATRAARIAAPAVPEHGDSLRSGPARTQRSHPGGTLAATNPWVQNREATRAAFDAPDEDVRMATSRYPLPLFHAGADTATPLGGTHGIGIGTHSVVPNEFGGSFSNLCERRLAFELAQHRAPEQATRSLIHRVMDVASKSDEEGFITCPDLHQIFSSVGVKLSGPEVELLATGFASNGKGGVDAQEFCEAVRALLYNVLGEHAALAAEEAARIAGGQGGDAVQQARDELMRLLKEICEGIIAHDKRAVLGHSPDIFKALLRPFVERDTEGSGMLDFGTFTAVLKDIGALLTHQDYATVARHFLVGDGSGTGATKAPSAYPSSNLSHIQAFRDAKLAGSLRGAAKANPVFGEWLAGTSIGLEEAFGPANGGTGDAAGAYLVEYTPFVTELAELMVRLLEQNGGVSMGTQFPWVLREFEFVDTLIVQLEEMQPSHRRKVLMALQYALSAADPNQECELDGFTVLNALLNAGFRLQRVNRVRLLRAVEELGGKMDYRDLCQVLLNSCADWTSEEKHVVKKILKAMGVTVVERRSWLARLRQLLMEASAKIARKSGRWFASDAQRGAGTGMAGVEDAGAAGASAGDSAMGIPPASFLHCLRECGVVLNVEEEATLLDCLDTERLSKLGQVEAEYGSSARALVVGKENWSVPMIHYETFLNYCARHCGSWMDAAPEVNEALKGAVASIANPVLAVHEFAALANSFDETTSGFISKRAFQICCHRSRLLANLPDEAITALSEVLTVDGGGRVDCTRFVVHLRALSSNIGADAKAPTILSQLVHNATDKRGTLLPLRNWLIRKTDMETFILTTRDLNALLREFGVMYRPEDLERLQMDIGRHVDADSLVTRGAGTSAGSASNRLMNDDLTAALGGGGGTGTSAAQMTSSMKKHVVDSRDLLMQVLRERAHWTTTHPYLAKRILRALKISGAEMFASGSGARSAGGGGFGGLHHQTGVAQLDRDSELDPELSESARHEKVLKGPRGIETAVARRILARLRAFAGRTNSIGAVDRETRLRDGDQMMVERDIFKHLAGVTGLPLSDEDVLVLADASDFLPEAGRVRCDVILEALLGEDPAQHLGQSATFSSSSAAAGNGDSTTAAGAGGGGMAVRQRKHLSEAGIYALNHLRDLLWTHAARLHRTMLEWVADVRTVFAGFDPRKTGFISSEDFTIALGLLNSSVSPELLLDITYFPEGPGLIDYRDILDYVLVPPIRPDSQTQAASNGKNSSARADSDHFGKNPRGGAVHKKAVPKESPVQALINVIRKSLHQFIVTDHSLEKAWVCLLKVFQRFDPQESNSVSPRDFCLAVSVLLDGDDIVLTKAEWAEIIDHFASLGDGGTVGGKRDQSRRQAQTDFLGGAMVDYMLFCEAVLDPNEIKMRLYEQKHDDTRARLERSRQHLSTAPSARGGTRGVSSASGRGGRGNASAGADSGRGFDGGVSGTRFGASRRPTSSHAVSRHTERKLHYDDPSSDPALQRMLANRPNSSAKGVTGSYIDGGSGDHGGGGGGSGGQSRKAHTDSFSYAGRRSPWAPEPSSRQGQGVAPRGEPLYRTARTAGQASRDAARGKKNMSLTGSSPPRHTGSAPVSAGGDKYWGSLSAKMSYASSHGNRGSNAKTRFKWDG